MDRPIPQNETQRLQIIGRLKLIAAVIMIVLLFIYLRWLITPSVERSQIRTATVQQGNIKASIRASGVLVPRSVETINSLLESRILKLSAQAGQYVEKGDLIMELDTRQVNASVIKLQEKLALKDQLIQSASLRLSKDLNDINSRLALLEVDLESRKARESRLHLLRNNGATAEQDLLEAKLNVKRTEIEITQLNQSKSDLRQSSQAEIAALELEKSILHKELEEKQHLLDSAIVRAPRAGVLSWLKNEEGASVNKTEPLARIADTNHFKVKATLSDFYASQLVSGMTADIYYKEQRLTGRLATLSPTIENGVMSLIIDLEDISDLPLKNNLRVDVRLITEQLSNVHTIAKGPFINGSGKHDVFVIKDTTAYKKSVLFGASDRQQYQVIDGLSPGDEIIISDISDYIHLDKIQVN
ncbi:efflux RND transporter periplasmic adaptor subunit [Aliikangiella sp. G2MR2-5]|uniref:efflux RND transporter periplasmic adaptor subunit n=1 Tax=Aliikangiella sp. G2MR2-5 TaxID=2788943 RepID=UPI0018AC1CF9|nr:HlyD family efflux transporter periplasmic adaptor subunit [Aliikangiella sp. G2MR2-5]